MRFELEFPPPPRLRPLTLMDSNSFFWPTPFDLMHDFFFLMQKFSNFWARYQSFFNIIISNHHRWMINFGKSSDKLHDSPGFKLFRVPVFPRVIVLCWFSLLISPSFKIVNHTFVECDVSRSTRRSVPYSGQTDFCPIFWTSWSLSHIPDSLKVE